jgi:hypothetical protein
MTPATLALLLLGACTSVHDDAPAPAADASPSEGSEAPAPPAPEEAGPTDVAAAALPRDSASAGFPLPSTWSSPACEGRAYERRITFDGDRYRATDLVAPCPPGTACVWSGIIERGGSWRIERSQLRLVPDADAPASPKEGHYPLPEMLLLTRDGSLTEAGGACPYTRGE